ncbi:pentatricopeptide repeat-containing protein At2g30100, chloroplastic [Dioscorea cayenensis subsp. rotundata]|uniref:Pentatricopeptide repeat-containing protein At2g30100, chloroplastic n=1 Tax=Dioscorea cayennensis subsp. rotundata TaxID=55577 RepID=A0AB40BRR9_DIOCR|nr:pentatricopeptide repeat-containing protein At2g30100, chloroplastic [Dioscorea cayenensis subsp. rotundata]
MAIQFPIPTRFLVSSPPSRHLHLLPPRFGTSFQHPWLSFRLPFKSLKSVRFDQILTSSEEEMGDGFFETIEELERMVRDPSDVLGGMIERLSVRELQLMLVYFSQEGRDSYCALEVFDWLRKENRVDGETMELMVSIACGWIERMVGGEHAVADVVGLLNEMECVGVEPGFSMVEKVVSLYWEQGKKDAAVAFVTDVMNRGGVGGYKIGKQGENEKEGPVGYLAWKMMGDGNYLGAVKLVIEFKEYGLNPEVYSYLIALTALVKEQKEYSKALRKLKASRKAALVAELDAVDLQQLGKYQSDLIRYGIRLSDWAIKEGSSVIPGAVHERLLAMYTCAGFGLEAENQLWQMKLSGKEPDRELYDVVLAICASQNEADAVRRLLAGVEATSAARRKKTLSWLLRGYVKGGYYINASETLLKMLDLGLCPEYLDRAAVLQGLRKAIQESGNPEPYIKLCKRLCDTDLIGPCLIYVYIDKYRLWIVKTI